MPNATKKVNLFQSAVITAHKQQHQYYTSMYHRQRGHNVFIKMIQCIYASHRNTKIGAHHGSGQPQNKRMPHYHERNADYNTTTEQTKSKGYIKSLYPNFGKKHNKKTQIQQLSIATAYSFCNGYDSTHTKKHSVHTSTTSSHYELG